MRSIASCRPSRRRLPFAALTAALAAPLAGQAPAAPQPPAPLTIVAAPTHVCDQNPIALSARRGSAGVVVDWSFEPAAAGSLVDAQGNAAAAARGATAGFRPAGLGKGVAAYGAVTITARDGAESASTQVRLDGLCAVNFLGEVVRATAGYEQIGASGIKGDQKFAVDFYISRPIRFWGEGDPASSEYFGTRLRWWGDVRVASYPQPQTAQVASFATGFVGSAQKVELGKLVRTAEFTTGPEVRLLSSSYAVRGIPEPTRQRFVLTAFAGFGATGPFPLDDTEPTVFAVPKAGTPQLAEFRKVYHDTVVKTKYVAFRAKAPDRFLPHLSGGLRFYTFYADRAGAPLPTAPAMVSVSVGRNDLIVPLDTLAASRAVWGRVRPAWHFSAFYPFPLGDRADPETMIIYLFGDVRMSGTRANFAAPAYQLVVATDSGRPIPLDNVDVTIVPTLERPRDTYRVGVSIDLLKVWRRLTDGTPRPGGATP